LGDAEFVPKAVLVDDRNTIADEIERRW